MRRWSVAAAVAAAVALAFFVLGGDAENPPPGEQLSAARLGPLPADALWVSTSGSDDNPGSREEPWKSLETALSAAEPGDTIAVAPGTYGARGTTIEIDSDGEAAAPITLRGEPGEERPRLLGAVRISASHVRIADLVLDGPTGSVQEPTDENPRGEQVQLAIDAAGEQIEDIWIYDSEIRNSDWHAGIFITNATDVRIVGNYIHGNGDAEDPGQENLSHGVYWASGSGLIANNVIEGNLARGVQLFPDPSGVTVTHNTIVENGKAGVQVAKYASSNTITNNIVAFNGDIGIRTDSLSGGDNVAADNLMWDNTGLVEDSDGELTITGTIAEPPGFAAGGGYELAEDSAAVDRADPSDEVPTDILGRARPQGAASDLGAYESW